MDEIVARLRGTIPAREAVYAIDRMIAKGYAVADGSPADSREVAFWDALGLDGAASQTHQLRLTVSTRALGETDLGSLTAQLTELDIAVSDHGSINIVLTDDYLRSDLKTVNSEALEHERPWLLCKPVGLELWIGPLFVPGRTACWSCLAQRLRGHRRIESYLEDRHARRGPFPVSRPALPSTQRTALSLLATEAARWAVAGRNERLEGAIFTLDTTTLETRRHVLVRRPQCPDCGEPGAIGRLPTAPPRLRSRPKVDTADCGHRSARPEETLKRWEHHVSPVTGIVRALASNAAEEHSPALSYVTDHSFAHLNDDLWFLRESLRSRSGGKGKQDVQARASALCESIERYSGVFQGDEPRVRARLDELGDDAILPNDLMLFSEAQYRDRQRWNANGSVYNWVPEPFGEDMAVDWSPLWSLTQERYRYLPTACCYYGYGRKMDVQFARADSNGCAAGNSREEAVLQGFMELVERDAVALWWYNRLCRPAVDLSSFSDPYVQRLVDYYRDLARDVWVLDITNDLNIPTFSAISRRTDKATEDIILGFGAHFDASVALVRSLTELNQSLPDVFHGTPDPNAGHLPSDRASVEWLNTATLENQPYLGPSLDRTPCRAGDYETVGSDDLLEDVERCLRIAEDRGLEVLLLDQTRPDIGMDVVKVVVPGLRPFWARFAPGRLYDVPVELGWLETPLGEADLNPLPLFF